jgi:DNA-binding CsgD family transcriptional regulator
MRKEPRLDGSAIPSRLAGLTRALGGQGFEESLAGLLAALADIEQCNVFLFAQSGETRCLFSWNAVRPQACSLARRYVEGGFFAQDPALLSLRKAPRPRMERLHRDDINDPWYRRVFFDEVNLGGKLAIFEPAMPEGVYLNFYHAAQKPEFSAKETGNLAFLSPFLAEILLKHHEMTRHASAPPGLETMQELLIRKAPRLAGREIEVCARIVGGFSSEAIALELGIAASSVATYRKRAYAKLGISSQNELFALCLEAAR